MIHADYQVLDWLREHCQHDRVLHDALNNHSSGPRSRYDRAGNRWFITATSRGGKVYQVAVTLDPVTGDPHQFYRVGEEDA